MTLSYLSAHDANAWAEARGYQHWAAIEDAEKIALLNRASEMIDQSFDFRGRIEDHMQTQTQTRAQTRSQTRSWPRVDAFTDDGRAIDGIPQAVLDATMLVALALTEGEAAAESLLGFGRQIKQQKAGGIEIQYEAAASAPVSRVVKILEPYLRRQAPKLVTRG